MMPMIIGISGKKYSGKGVVASTLFEYGYVQQDLATPLKKAIIEMFGFTEEQVWGNLKEAVDPYWRVTPRLVMQNYGTEFARKMLGKIFPGLEWAENNFWTLRLEKWILDNKKENFKVVVSDVRFPNEVEIIRKYGGEVWRIVRPGLNREEENFSEHASETSLDDYTDWDNIFINDKSIEELQDRVRNYIQRFEK